MRSTSGDALRRSSAACLACACIASLAASGCGDGASTEPTDADSPDVSSGDAIDDSSDSGVDSSVNAEADASSSDAPSDAKDDAPAPGRPWLVLHGFNAGTVPYPDYVAKNADFLDTTPFDGLFIHLGAPSAAVMTNTPLALATVQSALSPLTAKKPKKVTQNFALVFSSSPADFFDDWTTPVQNFANMARAAKDAGLIGVAFDNEAYEKPSLWGRYPTNCKYAATKTLVEYQTQARLRGKQIMAAMVEQFPAIVVITFHGPYISEPKAPSPPLPSVATFNNLLGPLFVGFVEGAGSGSVQVDGGEIYGLRTKPEFQTAFQFRKIDIASAKTDCAFIPSALRPTWSAAINVGFGLYDLDDTKGTPYSLMDPAVIRSNVTNSMHQTERWVWFYTETIDFLRPTSAGGAPTAWIDAVQNGKVDALAGWKPPWP